MTSAGLPQGGLAATLVGREREVALIDAFLDSAVGGGAASVVRGEPGVGKTVLLEVAAEAAAARGMRVLRGSGVEFEAGVSYSGLNQLLLPVNAEFSRLRDGERDALTVALGLGAGVAPEPLVVCNATLALLRALASEQPVLVVVDDVHWLDRASALVLGFAARRLAGTRIGLLAASRTGVEAFFDRGGMDQHEVQPLDSSAAASLVDSRFPSMASHVRGRLLAEALGNPLALLELPGALTGPQRAAQRALPALLPLTRRLQALFASRLTDLPEKTRQLLLLAILDGSGDLRILRAAGSGDAWLDGLVPAERAQLVYVDESTARIAFRHPLIRSAVVEMSSRDERRRAHLDLAELLADHPERRAWHLAEAAVEPDEEVAALLEQAAHRILQRGDAVGAIAALTRAADLSPTGAGRARRLAEAAYVGAEVAGELRSASALLEDARQADPQHGDSLPAAGAAVYLLINGDGDVSTAHRLLVGAIETGAHGYDAGDEDLVEALHNLLLLCWFGGRPELWEPFYAALARLQPGPPHLLSVLSRTFPDPVRTAAAALDDFEDVVATLRDERDPTRIMRAGTASVYVDRLGDSREGAWRLVQQGREGGPARRHLGSLMHLCLDDFVTGQWDEAQRLADEGMAVCDAHGYRFFAWYFLYHQAILAAVRGDGEASQALADRITRWAVPRGVHSAELFAHHPRVLVAMGRGDFEAAYRHATALSPAGTLASHVPHALWVAFDVVEAAMRTDRRLEASAHVSAMRDANVAAISPRLALLQLGSAAVAAPDDAAPALFEQALAVPNAERWQFEAARIRLCYGERLRRARATTEARTQLARAAEVFQSLGAHPWTARAGNELRATGQSSRRPAGPLQDELTAQEREIALLAAGGLSNKQIGERLFLSHRTVGAHLYRIFPKLGITSRAALRDALEGEEGSAR
ncbi:MAG TPA: BREX system ATP-binding domain-containing protein [Candidatus Dormibacteraeota bacterium]|nr:BREX system ATP-binding domain-containing protein [Candidatus Dormibacteraeota bacterium]